MFCQLKFALKIAFNMTGCPSHLLLLPPVPPTNDLEPPLVRNIILWKRACFLCIIPTTLGFQNKHAIFIYP